jgi:hypothetical protein
MDEAVRDDVKPSVELVLTASAYLDSGRTHWLDRTIESAAQDVLKRGKPVTPVGQQRTDAGVAEVRELDLDVRAARGERPLDRVEIGRARRTGEPEARHLVERRTGLGEGRDPASDRHRESFAAGLPAVGGSAGLGDQLGLGMLDALGQAGIAEHRCSVAVHLQNWPGLLGQAEGSRDCGSLSRYVIGPTTRATVTRARRQLRRPAAFARDVTSVVLL